MMGLRFILFLGGLAAMAGLSAFPAVSQSAAEFRQLGLSLRDQGQYPAAISALRRAVELEPADLSGRVLLGWTLHRAGERQAAAAVLSQTVQFNPFHVPALNALGIVYLVDGQLTQAALAHNWAALLKPDNEIAYYNLSLALQRLQYFDGAIVTAQEAARLEPSNPHPLLALAIAHWSRGDRDAAQQAYREALGLNSGFADLTYLQEDLSLAGFSTEQIQQVQQMR